MEVRSAAADCRARLHAAPKQASAQESGGKPPHSKMMLRDYRTEDFQAICEIDRLCFEPGISYAPQEVEGWLSLPGAFAIVAEGPTEPEPNPTEPRPNPTEPRLGPTEPQLKQAAGFAACEKERFPPQTERFPPQKEPPSPQTDDLPPSVNIALAGFILARRMWVRIGHIITIDVLPEHRRSGLGVQLMQGAEDRFRALGVQRVRLEVSVENHAAMRFYQKLGYQIVSRIPRYYLDRIDAWSMQREL